MTEAVRSKKCQKAGMGTNVPMSAFWHFRQAEQDLNRKKAASRDAEQPDYGGERLMDIAE